MQLEWTISWVAAAGVMPVLRQEKLMSEEIHSIGIVPGAVQELVCLMGGETSLVLTLEVKSVVGQPALLTGPH